MGLKAIETHTFHSDWLPLVAEVKLRHAWRLGLVPEGRAERIGYEIALIVVILAALGINRSPPKIGSFVVCRQASTLTNG
jgi:hypothetical protein